MSDSIPIIQLDKAKWIDIYTVSGVAVGTVLEIEALNAGDVRLHIGADKPTDADGYELVIKSQKTVTPVSPTGIWAYSEMGCAVYVREYVGETVPVPFALFDGDNNPLSSYYDADTGKWVLNIHDADVHHRPVNKYLHQHTGTSTTLSADSAVNDYQINVADTAGFIVGNSLHINTSTAEPTHPTIIAITPGTPGIFTLDRRLDRAHFIGDEIENSIIDLAAQIGTLAIPQVYWAGPEPGEVWHIETLTLAMGHGSAGDLGLFGNLTKLINGVIVRSFVGGNYGTLTNWKTNGDIDVDTGNVKFPVRSGGGGTHGTTTTGPFKNRTGAILRLDGDLGDRFEVYNQDDLTGIIFWNMKVQGHIEDS